MDRFNLGRVFESSASVTEYCRAAKRNVDRTIGWVVGSNPDHSSLSPRVARGKGCLNIAGGARR